MENLLILPRRGGGGAPTLSDELALLLCLLFWTITRIGLGIPIDEEDLW